MINTVDSSSFHNDSKDLNDSDNSKKVQFPTILTQYINRLKNKKETIKRTQISHEIIGDRTWMYDSTCDDINFKCILFDWLWHHWVTIDSKLPSSERRINAM